MTRCLPFQKLCGSALLPLVLLGVSSAVHAQTTLFDFNTVNTIPRASLTEIAPGKFIGLGVHYPSGPGGSNDLVIYQLTSGGVYSQIYDFGSGNCFAGFDAPIQALDGNLWGYVVEFCKTNSQSFIYRLAPDGSNIWFPYTTRSTLFGPLIQGPRGFLYGADENGGTGSGSIFRISLSGVYQTVAAFNGSNGNSPTAPLVQTSDGSIWGTTRSGGSSNQGTIFRVDPSGTLALKHSFNGTDGETPSALAVASDGTLYGTTLQGGSQFDGTIFSFDPTSSNLTSRYTFSGNYLQPGGVGQEPSPLQILPDGTLAGIVGFDNMGWNTLFFFNPAENTIAFTTPPQIGNGSGYGYLTQTVQGGLIGLDEGDSTNGLAYEVTEPPPSPSIEVLPSSVKVGHEFYAIGNYLLGATSVTLDGAALTFQVESANSIRITPPGSPTSGFLQITTPYGVATSPSSLSITF